MIQLNTEKVVNLVCTERSFPEFPNLLFGTSPEGASYFDASAYTSNNDVVHSFFHECATLIEKLTKSYQLASNQIAFTNKQGHILIDGNFTYLFLSFVEPDFLAFIYDRIHEMFAKGVVVSDSYLLHHALIRLPQELLVHKGGKEEK